MHCVKEAITLAWCPEVNKVGFKIRIKIKVKIWVKMRFTSAACVIKQTTDVI
jgi:hypothetical protein